MLGNQSEAHSVAELRDAIIELYLAIKIRSTEEVSTVDFLRCLRSQPTFDS